MKAYVEAHGCALNIGESRELEEELLSLGWELADSPSGADLAVLATCVVVEKTERDMLKRVRALSSVPRLVVTGCMATTDCRARATLIAPHAEFVPPVDPASFRRLVPRAGPRKAHRARDACAIVPVATGCLGDCSYCITRCARGALRSRPVETVVDAVSRAAGGGPTEIQLTAQDTASYGSDIGSDLVSLVSCVCSAPLEFRLRVGMMSPMSALRVSDRLPGMYLEPKVFKFLHMPVQSGSDRLLEEMGRGHTAAEFHSVVDRIRAEVPGLSFSTDLIIGYPGETEEDHEANLEVVRRSVPDIVNVTKFSPRPGTRACGAPSRVPGRVVKERSKEITRLRFKVALDRNRAWVGREVRVLVTEHVKEGTTVTRTDEYRQVVVPGRLPLGGFHDVIVEGATPTYLIGRRTD